MMIINKVKEYYLVWGIPTLLLLLTPFSWPYGYYTFLRIALTISAALICYWHMTNPQKKYVLWGIIFGLLALLYNPVIPVHLLKQTWFPINIATALIYIGNIIFLLKIEKE